MAFVRFVALAMCFLMAVSAPPAAFAQYSDSEPPLEPGGIPSPIMDEVKMGNLDAYAFIPFVDDYGRMFDVTVYFASSTARVKGPGLDQTAPIDPATAQAVKDLLVGSRNGTSNAASGAWESSSASSPPSLLWPMTITWTTTPATT